MDEKSAHLAFSVSPIGPKSFQKLIANYGSAKNAWEKSSREKYFDAGINMASIEKFERFKQKFDLIDYIQRLAKAKVEYIALSDKYYPDSLKKLPDAPIGLFVRGNKKLLVSKQNIGVVGTRKITSYGSQVTESIVSELVRNNIVITSGMAMGVDSVSHRAALENKGSTIAVLGCGVDCPFPRENEGLYEEIIDSNSLIISEYALGVRPNKGTFPARNRIIAGVSLGILVTEAGEESGSLITAKHAREQKKLVFAVPGPITSQVSKGTLKLLREGAVLVSSAEDILESLDLKVHNSKLKSKIQSLKLNKEERKIIRCLENENMTMDQIAKASKIQISKLAILLSEMEILGLLKNSNGTWKIN